MMKVIQKNISPLLILLLLLSGTGSALFGQSAGGVKKGINTIVLDPGHGGYQPGTVFGTIYEKDITLKVALRLGNMIEANHKDVKVIYTRTTDKHVDLVERGNIANRAGADIFLSIHVNAAKSATPTGTSTWIMGVDKQSNNLDVVMRENDVVNLEEDYTVKYQGYTPNDPDSYIIFSLMQYANSGQSMQLASMIQKHYKRDTPLPDQGARMGPYLVLWRTAMPSVLTEMGFMTNERDRKYITSKAGQERMATCLFNAFSEYKAKVEGKSNPVVLAVRAVEDTGGRVEEDLPIVSSGGEYFFAVQVCSSPKKVPKNSSTFKDYRGQVTEHIVEGRYKYCHGRCSTYAQAIKLQSKVRKSIPDAFIVAFRGDSPVSVREAREALK